jgi:hypothetical protein
MVDNESSFSRLIDDLTQLSIGSEDTAGGLGVSSVVTADEFLDMGLRVHYNEKQLQNSKRSTKLDWFVSQYGCSPLICAMLWNDLQTTTMPRAKVKRSKAKPQLFLMTLHHFKVYPRELQAKGTWSISRKTYRKWVKCFAKKIRQLKREKIVWPDDFGDDIWIITVDGTHCWVNEPMHCTWSQDRKLYSHKYNKAGICYGLGISSPRSVLFG